MIAGVTGTSRTWGLPGTHVLDHGGPDMGPLLVLLHGFGGSALNWQLVAPVLARVHRVVAVDLYAHGWSSAPEDLTAESVVAQVMAAVEAALEGRARPVVLVAGSFGAAMAFRAAGERPDLVQGIVAVDGAIPMHPGRRLDLVMELKRRLISAPGISGLVFRKTSSMSPREYVELQLTQAGVESGRVDAGLMDVSVALEKTRHQDRAAHDAQQRLLGGLLRMFARGRDFGRMTAAVTAPVLWLHSEDDPLIPFYLARDFVAQHPGWQLRSRPGLGHVPMVVDPEWVSGEVLAWVEEQHLA
jgi:pimeloyl-ACP methyl ester carboxylesterase